ncbi:MAG: PepSY domain-containing protein [Deltaproteobacteria bacterium]|nr:PepSY domain-containing protein [Deltaproteobacteria bacterium]
MKNRNHILFAMTLSFFFVLDVEASSFQNTIDFSPHFRISPKKSTSLQIAKKDTSTVRLISEAVAKKRAEAKYGGRALSAKLFEAKGKLFYKVKMIKNGRIDFVKIPAEQ